MKISLALLLTLVSFMTRHAAAAEAKNWDEFFPNLVNAHGEKVSPAPLQGKLVCLYFSASWCGPCKFVTPKLVALRDPYTNFVEVVFVSQDRSEAEQLKYMRESKMQWPAVKWANYKANDGNDIRKLLSKYQGWGIPTLTVLSRSGDVIEADASRSLISLPEEQIKKLEEYDYAAALKSYRDEKAKKGETLTKAQEDEYVRHTRSRLEEQIRKARRLYEQSLKPEPLGDEPSWDQLLCDFYRSQRLQTAK